MQTRHPCRLVALVLPLLVATGCSSEMNRWVLPPVRWEFSPSERLCEFRGKRLAIVLGREFDDLVKPGSHDFRSTPASWSSFSATGDLNFSVDGGSKFTLPGGAIHDPEALSAASAFYERMGFQVVDRQHVAVVLEEQDVQAVFSQEAARLGQLLGADVLVIVSTLKQPIVYFAAGGWGDYMAQPDLQIRGHEIYISVADGTTLGHSLSSFSTMGLSGFRHLVARRTVGLFATARITFHGEDAEGKSKPVVSTALQHLEERLLDEWRELCR